MCEIKEHVSKDELIKLVLKLKAEEVSKRIRREKKAESELLANKIHNIEKWNRRKRRY